jgi:Ca2+-binding RTX toxin-like protein
LIRRINHKTALWILFILIFISALTAIAAANTVPTTRLAQMTATMNANAIKPASCSALNLTAILICPSAGGACNGTNANELILGSPSDDNIHAGKGDDCILGGGGNDAIRGEQDTDVCIGGPGTDSFHPTCETPIQ